MVFKNLVDSTSKPIIVHSSLPVKQIYELAAKAGQESAEKVKQLLAR